MTEKMIEASPRPTKNLTKRQVDPKRKGGAEEQVPQIRLETLMRRHNHPINQIRVRHQDGTRNGARVRTRSLKKSQVVPSDALFKLNSIKTGLQILYGLRQQRTVKTNQFESDKASPVAHRLGSVLVSIETKRTSRQNGLH